MDTQGWTPNQPTTYQIKVLGAIDKDWLDWKGGLTTTMDGDIEDIQIPTLTINVDQAGFHGLLRRHNSLSLPLISVVYIEQGAMDE